MMLVLVALIGAVVGADYSHKYDTFEIRFSTPSGITAQVDWGKGDSFLPIDIFISLASERIS
jgi:hypothetical protein